MDDALDRLWAALGPNPDQAALRRYYQALLASDLLLPVTSGAEDRIVPHLVELEGQEHALAFIAEARLAAFFEDGAERVELSGLALLEMLSAQGLGLALNPGMDEGQFFLEPEIVDWLVQGGVEAQEKTLAFQPLGAVEPPVLAQILDAVGTLSGRAKQAVLAMSQSGGLVLVLVEADASLAPDLGRLLSLIETGQPLELLFLSGAETRDSGLDQVGLALEIPEPKTPKPLAAPGSDPDKPPRL